MRVLPVNERGCQRRLVARITLPPTHWSWKYLPISHELFGHLALGLPQVDMSGAPLAIFFGKSVPPCDQNQMLMASLEKSVAKTPPPARRRS